MPKIGSMWSGMVGGDRCKCTVVSKIVLEGRIKTRIECLRWVTKRKVDRGAGAGIQYSKVEVHLVVRHVATWLPTGAVCR